MYAIPIHLNQHEHLGKPDSRKDTQLMRDMRGAITKGLDFDVEAVAPTIVVMLTNNDNQSATVEVLFFSESQVPDD